MPYRIVKFETDGFYHIFNRGVNKQIIFEGDRDYQRFMDTLLYYQHQGPKPRFSNKNRFRLKDISPNPKIVNIVAFCFMPNHFHLLVQQLQENGGQDFMSKIANSYTRYFNTKHQRVGPLFQGEFKSVSIDTDEQLLHVSRYIHLNPYVAEIVKDLKDYPYSSFHEYVGDEKTNICFKEPVLNAFKGKDDYRSFIRDYEDYALQISRIKHLIIEDY